MVLNRTCIKDILSYIAERESAGPVDINPHEPPFSTYSREELVYHYSQCDLVGYLEGAEFLPLGAGRVQRLTPKGREILAGWTA